MTRNLVITPIGDRSVHRTWLAGPDEPNFDLFLIYYGDGADTAQADAKYYLRRKGFKWEHMHYVVEEHGQTLSQYDRIWCPDDDVACSTADVNLLFELFERYRLQLAQPAVARGEFFFRGLTQRRGNLLRYSPFVELMCPIFTREAFVKVQPTFVENRSGWGIDWVWTKYFTRHEMAIIDKVGVHHTGQLGKGAHYKNLARLGVDPFRELEETVARHGLNLRLHRRMMRGIVLMKSIRDPDDRRGWLQRLRDDLEWMLRKRTMMAPDKG